MGDTRPPPPIVVATADEREREQLTGVLSAAGRVAAPAPCQESALEMARAYGAQLVLSGHPTPVALDGEAVLRRLATEPAGPLRRAAPVLLASTEAQRRRAELLGARSLLKPFSVEDLLEALD